MRKIIALLFLPWVLLADTYYTSDGNIYQGQDQATIQAMLTVQGSTATFVTLSQFNQISAANASAIQAIRQNAQASVQAYVIELSTTQSAIAAAAPNYVAANVITQIKINQMMARIIQLRVLLGLQ